MINQRKLTEILTKCAAIRAEIMLPSSAKLIQQTESEVVGEIRKKILDKMSKPTQEKLGKSIGYSQSYVNLLIHSKRTPKNAKEILTRLAEEMSK